MAFRLHLCRPDLTKGRRICLPERDKNMNEPQPIPKSQFYAITSISKADPPDGAEGTNWHCYVIEQGSNCIRGFRQGTQAAVREAVEEIVAQLNERRLGKRGRINMPAAKKKS